MCVCEGERDGQAQEGRCAVGGLLADKRNEMMCSEFVSVLACELSEAG